MQQPLLARPSFRSSVLGLTLGAVASMLPSAVLLGASAAADAPPSQAQAVFEATHLPPLLVAAGEIQPYTSIRGLDEGHHRVGGGPGHRRRRGNDDAGLPPAHQKLVSSQLFFNAGSVPLTA